MGLSVAMGLQPSSTDGGRYKKKVKKRILRMSHQEPHRLTPIIPTILSSSSSSIISHLIININHQLLHPLVSLPLHPMRRLNRSSNRPLRELIILNLTSALRPLSINPQSSILHDPSPARTHSYRTNEPLTTIFTTSLRPKETRMRIGLGGMRVVLEERRRRAEGKRRMGLGRNRCRPRRRNDHLQPRSHGRGRKRKRSSRSRIRTWVLPEGQRRRPSDRNGEDEGERKLRRRRRLKGRRRRLQRRPSRNPPPLLLVRVDLEPECP